jgi:hypothetical protein
MKRALLGLVAALSLAACVSTNLASQVTAEANAVQAAAVAAANARNAGVFKAGSKADQDITVALVSAQAAVDNAGKSLEAGNTATAAVYLNQAVAAMDAVSTAFAQNGVK